MKKSPQLKKIDLSKSTQTKDGGFTHPDIQLDKWYLAKIEGLNNHKFRLAAGHFDMQWYGLNFGGFYDAGLQFDRSGFGLWEIEG